MRQPRLHPKGFWKSMTNLSGDYKNTSDKEILMMLNESCEWLRWTVEALQRRIDG